MKKNLQKGFTLIELLVVIAIIGILSAIVLASLSTARSKAKDAKLQGELSEMRAAAEIYYSSATNYGTATAACNQMFVDVANNSGMNALTVAANADSNGSSLVCNSTGTAWAAQARLSNGGYWCVDSSGASKSAATSTVPGNSNC